MFLYFLFLQHFLQMCSSSCCVLVLVVGILQETLGYSFYGSLQCTVTVSWSLVIETNDIMATVAFCRWKQFFSQAWKKNCIHRREMFNIFLTNYYNHYFLRVLFLRIIVLYYNRWFEIQFIIK